MHLKKDGKDQSSESVVDGSTRYFETDHLLADISRRTVRGSIVTMSTHGLKFGISIIATAILARLLTPQDYGLICSPGLTAGTRCVRTIVNQLSSLQMLAEN